jgi:hypothetical protein
MDFRMNSLHLCLKLLHVSNNLEREAAVAARAAVTASTHQPGRQRLGTTLQDLLTAAKQVRLLRTLREHRLAARGLETRVLQGTLQHLRGHSMVVTVGHFNVLSTKKSDAVEK